MVSRQLLLSRSSISLRSGSRQSFSLSPLANLVTVGARARVYVLKRSMVNIFRRGKTEMAVQSLAKHSNAIASCFSF